MQPHHVQSIHNITDYFQRDPEVRVLESAPEKPDGLMESIRQLSEAPTIERIELLYNKVKSFQPWAKAEFNWPAQFMFHSELNWLDGKAPVEDL